MRVLPFLLALAMIFAVAAEPAKELPSLQFSVPCLDVKEEAGKPPDFKSIFYELPLPEFPFKTDFFVADGW